MAEDEGKSRNSICRDKTVTEEVQKVAFYKLFAVADRLDVVLMILGSFGAMANGISQPLLTVVFGKTIHSFGSSSQPNIVKEVSEVALKFLYLAIGSSIAGLLQVSCWMVTGERQSARIRSLYLKTILGQDVAFFDTETTTGEVVGRLTSDTILIQEAMGEKVGKFIQLASTFFGGFLIAFIKGWLLTMVLLSCIPLVIICGGTMTMILSKMSSLGQTANEEAGNLVEQTVGVIRTVASFTGEKHVIEKYNAKLKVACIAAVHQGLVTGVGVGTMLLFLFGTYGLAVWYGSKLIMMKSYNGGQVITIILSVMYGGISLGQISPYLNAFAAGQAAAYKMYETIKVKPSIDAYDNSGMVLDDVHGKIEFRDVHFRYPSRPEIKIFSGFSLQIPGGKTTALVGQSGSGKSTIICLIERFYDPNSGEVLIDGVDLKKLKLSWIREKIGLVSQEPILFGTTIKENIAYGKENATDLEIRTAIELANATKLLDRMPEGLATMVGEHGTLLSGGEKQSIAIARALLRNPKILLLDEATSALDAESESIVQDLVQQFISNRTIVVVAHRLTTVRNADLIAVVHMGNIVEKGTHEELIQNPAGNYAQLVRLQEGAKEFEDSHTKYADLPGGSLDMHSPISTRISLRESLLGSHHSLNFNTVSFGLPGPINVNKDEEYNQSTNEKEKSKAGLLRRLAYLNKPELAFLFLGGIAAAVHGIIFPMFGLLLSEAIHTFYEPPAKLHEDSKYWALWYLTFGVVALIALPLQHYFFGVAGGKLIERLRSMTFRKVVHQDISWFDDPANSSGAICARLSTDASAVRSLVGDALALIVQNIGTVIAAIVIAFIANWRLALIILSVCPLIFIQGSMKAKFTKGFSADTKVMYEEASQVANDAVGSIRTVASFCAEKKVMNLYEKKCSDPIKQGVRLGLVSGAGFGLSLFVLYSTMAFCFYIGSVLVKHGKATFTEVFKVFFALAIAAVCAFESSGMGADTTKAKDSAASIFAILDSKTKIDSSSNKRITLAYVDGDIEFEHVSFRYPMRPNVQILSDLSLRIPSGKTVALVGESGCGKSTVISLIERFYDPHSGHIYLDSVEIKNLKLSWLRQQMGLVSQEPILFNETIRTNIVYGKQGVDAAEKEVIAAAKAANAHNFISSLPHGYSTSVGERGVELSGGQKQRIAIARAIVKNPKILLLDEATSALDAESERVVQDALDRVMVNRTTVVVAQRLTTVVGADIIAVVKNGAIVEKGRHEELLKITDGAYASLVALQMSTT